jgi:hypothetical protein
MVVLRDRGAVVVQGVMGVAAKVSVNASGAVMPVVVVVIQVRVQERQPQRRILHGCRERDHNHPAEHVVIVGDGG